MTDKKSKAKSQREKFEEAAHELETDKSEVAFDHLVKKIAKAPPSRDQETKPKKPAD